MFCTCCGLFRWEQVEPDAADESHGDTVRHCERDEYVEREPVRDRDAVRARYGDADPRGDRTAERRRQFGLLAAACKRRRLPI
jgi:hypothetical protein